MTITVNQKAFLFKIDDYEVDHQGGAILNIGVNLKYRNKRETMIRKTTWNSNKSSTTLTANQ